MSHMSHAATDLAGLIPDARDTASESRKPKLEDVLDRIEAALHRYFGEDEATMLNCLRGLR